MLYQLHRCLGLVSRPCIGLVSQGLVSMWTLGVNVITLNTILYFLHLGITIIHVRKYITSLQDI